ncbi:MAG: FAD:protein FMN transferase [Sediminispirochaetaceae bacterium]
MEKTFRRRIVLSVLALLIVISIDGCTDRETPVCRREITLIGRPMSVAVYGRRSEQIVRELTRTAVLLGERIDGGEENSQLALLSSMSGNRGVQVDEELYVLIEKSLNLARISSGLYDPTAAPLYRIWRRFWPSSRSPSRDEVYRVLEKVRYGEVSVRPRTREVFLGRPGMELDPGEIVDGYLLDRCTEFLLDHDFISAVMHYGDVSRYIMRQGEDVIHEEAHPVILDADLEPVLKLTDCRNKAVAIIYPRKRLILDPRNGYPVRTSLWCAAVVGPEAVTADALALILAAGGLDHGMQLINDMPFFEAICVTLEQEIYLSRDGRGYLKSYVPGYTPVNLE